MRQVLWSALLAIVPVLGYGQESKPQSTPPKQNGGPPAVMSPKATIPGPPLAEGVKPETPETDPSKMAASAPGAKHQDAGIVNDKTYVIGPEDGLVITVWGDKNLSGPYPVRPDGRISMSLVGEFMASDKTPEQLATAISERLKSTDILRDPQVTVSVHQVNSKFIHIIGEVNKPGKFPLVVPTNVLQALVNAGGFRDFANQKKIIIQRGTDRKNFNYKDVIAGKHTEQNIMLEPGDYIIVK